jgi:predicted nucleotidyltransferase
VKVAATALRRDLYKTLKELGAAPIEITRNERVVAVLARPALLAPVALADGQLRYEPRRLARICVRHGVRTLFLFGSAARGALEPASDIDVLADVPCSKRTFRAYATLALALEDLFGRRVELYYRDTFEDAAAPAVKASVLRDLTRIYGQA